MHEDSNGRRTPVIPVYHPSYMLRLMNADREKAKLVFEDFIRKLGEATER